MKNDIATNIRQSHFFSRQEEKKLVNCSQVEEIDECEDDNEYENDGVESQEMTSDLQWSLQKENVVYSAYNEEEEEYGDNDDDE